MDAVSKDDLRQAAEVLFKQLDTNGNGKLEKDEVRVFSQGLL